MGLARAFVILTVTACTYQAPASSIADDDDDEQPLPDGPAPDTSPPACDDADGDSVCDVDDACQGSDDLADGDGDHIADGCDDWPCGEAPADPSATVTVGNNTWGATLTNVNFGGGRRKVAAANSDVTLSFSFAIHDQSCGGNCIDQIEVGLVNGARQSCPFDQAVSKSQGATGNRSTTIRTPSTPGRYDVRYGLGENFECVTTGHTNWWLGEPAANHTIAILCVP